MSKKTTFLLAYLIADFIAFFLTWLLFYYLRVHYVEHRETGDYTGRILPGIIITIFWIVLFAFVGLYSHVLRKSRLQELIKILLITAPGSILIFFAIFLDDPIPSYRTYRSIFIVYLVLQFLLPSLIRFLISTFIKSMIEKGSIFFPTLLIGSNGRAIKVLNEINSNEHSIGQKIIGYVRHKNDLNDLLNGNVPFLGELEDLSEIIRTKSIEDIIVTIDSSRHQDIIEILDKVKKQNISVKITPDLYDVLGGFVRTDQILGTPLIEITKDPLHTSQRITKRCIDLFGSVFMVILLSPLIIILAVLIKLTSKGNIIYRQERIGIGGKPFQINKFRSMYVQAEKRGPRLTFDRDPRVTFAGKFMRKWRLDEIPQFWNVLRGEMSLVGPRPERDFFIRQILEKAPHYHILHRAKPGITSWGQVKFGYAKNVDEMIERMRYDLLYIENMSLVTDIKIILYTILTVLGGKGK